jgi:acetyltransferase-like isoleucine patch superfamily enzyme
MNTINNPDDLKNLSDNNSFIGTVPKMNNSVIKFYGENNILFCEENVSLINTTISFCGSNSIVFLCSNKFDYRLNVSIRNNSAFYMGKNNYMNGLLNVVLSERKHCFIGDSGIISFGIWIRNADPHLIYKTDTKKRINATKSIFIGDHVWIGQSAMILKGTQVDSGSIIGAMSVVAGKKIPQNSSWAGNPCKQVADGVFWDGACVHMWDEEQTKKSQLYSDFVSSHDDVNEDSYIYNYEKDKSIDFDDIDNALSVATSAKSKLEYLQSITANKDKNRFAHRIEIKKKKLWNK